MVAYIAKVKSYLEQLQHFTVEKIPRESNVNVDALAKLVSTQKIDILESVPMEFLAQPTIASNQMLLVGREEPSWMTPYVEYIQPGKFPLDKKEAWRIQYKAARYVLMDEILYTKENPRVM
uniref:RNase H type-1 domain-containing protein n=1 Tax=Cannabis sativa TaxID=3483 RepID=A0A803PTE0_CANSA